MKTVVLTDSKYRSAISAARSFSRGGMRVVAAQARGDTGIAPPVFSSCCVSGTRWLDGHAGDECYVNQLIELLRSLDRPVLFPVGAATLGAVSRETERFSEVCDFLISPSEVLDAVNDKAAVHRRASELGLRVPREYDGEPDAYPVIVKPRCGEKLGLKAGERYAVARNRAEYAAAMEKMRRYDPSPVVQELVDGDGYGASVLIDREGRLIGAFCHRRVREYPITGGPSACCESIYDPEKIDAAYALLRSFGFVGLAMVEFKGECILEVNPRVWGSFPLTTLARSPIALHCAEAASGGHLSYVPRDYEVGVRMRFALNDTLSTLSLLAHGRLREGFEGCADVFRAREALSDRGDRAPMRAYLKATVLKR